MVMTAENRAALADRLARLQVKGLGLVVERPVVSLGCPLLDAALPAGGLRRGAVHEVLGPDGTGDHRGDAAAVGFGAFVLGRIMQSDQNDHPAVWCMNRRVQYWGTSLLGQAYAPGLWRFGVAVDRLLFLYCNNDRDVLWAAEEAVRSSAASTVVAELDSLDSIATRRLQLAAETSGTTVLALRAGGLTGSGSFPDSRWCLTAWPRQAADTVCWRADLLRCRGGTAGQAWILQWHLAGLQAMEMPTAGNARAQAQGLQA
jgi:protein ImuA